MKKLKDYSKPLMVAEKFTPNEYVAICALPAQYLYADAIKPRNSYSYTTGSDGVFQDEKHFTGLLEFIMWFIAAITGNTYETNGEYMGIRTTGNPSEKGEKVTFDYSYPVYGSVNKLSDGDHYSGQNLYNTGALKKNSKGEYYIQANMS